MARTNNLTNFLNDVATAIKTKKGSEASIPATNFDTEILALPSQGVYEQRVLNISANGSQTITPSAGFDAIDELALTVAVPEKQLQSKTYNFTQNTNIELLPDTGYDGFDSVTLNINVPGSTINNQDKTITQNGVYTADSGYTGLGEVTVNVNGVKLFDTVAHMQADPNPQEGDLAVVYREETDPSVYYFEGLYEYSNNSYNLVQSQLNAVQNKVYQGTFYGANGVQTGTLTTNISSVFEDTNAEVYAKIQTYYNSLTPRVLTDQNKRIDLRTIIIPCKSDGTPLLDTSSVTDMTVMFRNCARLTTIPLLDTSNVTSMSHMFNSCSSLTTIPLLDTSSVTSMYNMFVYCSSLTSIPLLDTSSVTNMSNMFNSCSSLTSIPLLDTSSVTNMSNMFNRCTHLTSIPLLDTSNVTNMSSMFKDCASLTTIPLLNTSNVTNINNMFRNCSSLTNESLNNILAMCTNSAVSSNKTLAFIGLTQEQTTTCQGLSNYQAFVNAGWTTGY